MTVFPCARKHSHEGDTADGSALCTLCIGQAERTLRTLPVLHQECLHHAAPTSRRSNPTKVSGSRTRDHLNVSVLDTRYHVLAVLEAWADVVTTERGIIAPARTVPQLAGFLAQHLGWLVSQPPAADFADEIEHLAAELRSTIDPGSGERRTAVRRCVMDNCSGTIAPSLNFSERPRTSRLECSMGHVWEMREWLKLRSLLEQQHIGANS